MVKRKKHKGIPALIVLGLILIGIFYYIYGGALLLRIILQSAIFATITISLVKVLNLKLGKKRLFK